MSDAREIDSLIVNSLNQLPNIKRESDPKKGTSQGGVIFPKKRNNVDRISEQEARVLLYNQLANSNVYFSIETPTKKKYSFMGNDDNSRSGCLDVCIFKEENNSFQRTNCIEYKAHNKSIERDIKKDFEKLICEEGKNYFVHILSNVSSKTLISVVEKYVSILSSKDLHKKIKKRKNEKIAQSLVLYICILKPKFCILRKEINLEKIDWKKCDNNFFNPKMVINYTVSNNQLSIENSNWEIVPLDSQHP